MLKRCSSRRRRIFFASHAGKNYAALLRVDKKSSHGILVRYKFRKGVPISVPKDIGAKFADLVGVALQQSPVEIKVKKKAGSSPKWCLQAITIPSGVQTK